MRILVTGIYGFIGSAFARMLLKETEHTIVGFGRNSNQRNIKRLDGFLDNPKLQLINGDLAGDIGGILEQIDCVVNFAAMTFVDHSIRSPEPFIRSNIIGTYNLLEQVRFYKDKIKKMVQVSTDECYGSILEGEHTEESKLAPSNPYAATKCAADMLVLSYVNTFKIPALITRMENNTGEFQHPQKVIPTFVKKAMNNEKLPVYGDGLHRRMWLHVEDSCRAIFLLLQKGADGEVYNIAGSQELTNIDLAKMILKLCNKPESNIEFIDDSKIRPGHDRRYAINSDKLKKLGWKPEYNLEQTITKSVNWYVENGWWLK